MVNLNHKEKGQVVVILLLIMMVVLAIGLAAVTRSINEVSTSTKTEQTSRAFSAAEAGLEKIIQEFGNKNTGIITLGNNSSFSATSEDNLPDKAFESPNAGKDTFAQIWLANPSDLSQVYSATSFEIYFGDAKIDYTDTTNIKPAIEVHVISKNGNNYESYKAFLDSDDKRVGLGKNEFQDCSVNNNPAEIATNFGNTRKFYSKCLVSGYNNYPVLVRVRILYSDDSHPVALKPINGTLPIQAKVITSTGFSGESQRKIQVSKQQDVMPFFFDFALYAEGEL